MVEEDGFAFLRKSHGPANVPPARPLGRPFRTHPQIENEQPPAGVTHFLVEEDGFEPSKAKPADLQSVPFGHLGTPPYSVGRKKGGAGGRIRTPDLLITNQLLYRLSYTSVWRLSNSERYYNKESEVCQAINQKFFIFFPGGLEPGILGLYQDFQCTGGIPGMGREDLDWSVFHLSDPDKSNGNQKSREVWK